MVEYTVGPSGSGASRVVDGTNDQDEINAALQDAAANPGSTVYLEGPFTYDIYSTNLRIGSNTKLTGDSTACLKLHDSVGWATMLPIIGQIGGSGTATHDIEIFGFEIDANRWNQPESEGDAYHNCIGITGTVANPARNISVHDMKLHDSLGDGLRATHAENVNYYNNDVDVMGHEGAFYINVVGGEMRYNDVVQKCNSGFRTDNCQNIKIHHNTVHKYAGTGANGNGAIQIGNEPPSYNMPRQTNNIEIYENTIYDGAGSGILLMDADGSSGTTPQTVHIYNNKIYTCGWLRSIKYNGGISVWKWGNGLTIENNLIDSCYNAGIVITNAITGCSMQVYNNNIINTRNTLATDPTRMLPVSGYGILNAVPSMMVVDAQNNYMSGNVSGNYYQVTPYSEATVPNGEYVPGSSTGGTTTPATRYIPPIRIIQEELSNYYVLGEPKYGYINGVPFFWQEKDVDTGKYIGQRKPPGFDGENLTDFGFRGAELLLDCYAYSIDDILEVIAAFYDTSRGRAVLELGGPYQNKKITGLTVDHSSKLRIQDDAIPEDAHPYSIHFLSDKPVWESTTKRVRSRTVFGSMKWTSDNVYAGNILKNPSFEDWTQSNEMTWKTQTSTANIEWRKVKWSPDLQVLCAVAAGGTNNGVAKSSDGITWATPSELTSAANCNNAWRGLEWGSSIGLSGGEHLPGRWVAVSSSGTGNRCMTSDDTDTWVERSTPADNYWNDVCYVRKDADEIYRYIAVSSTGTNRVMYTNDGAVSWINVASADDTATWMSICYSSMLERVVAVSYDGKAMYSDNFGATWTLSSSVPFPAQKFTCVEWAEGLGLFVACTEDGTQQIATSPDGDIWTLQNTPAGGSTVVPGTGSDVATNTYQTPDGYNYTTSSTSYSAGAVPQDGIFAVAGLTNGHIWRIDRVFCDLRAAASGAVAWIKITAQTATIAETVLAEWAADTISFAPKTLDVVFESAANEAIQIRCYMKSSTTSAKAIATKIGYELTEFDGAGGATISYTYNAWKGLEWSPENGVLVAVAASGIGNRAMRSKDAVNWVLCENVANNNWQSVCYAGPLNMFTAVSSNGTGNRVMTSDDYGGIQAPVSWVFEGSGQSRTDTVAHDGLHGLQITGDGSTVDIGLTKQYVSFEPGVSYVISAWGSVSGLTAGKLAVEIYSGNSVITQLIWDADCEYTQLQDTVRFDTAPTDAYIRVHGVDIVNDGALLYCDDILLSRGSDFEVGTTGSDIVTYGNQDVVPDVEIRAISSSSGTSEVSGDTKTYLDPDVHSEFSTSYSQEFIYVLPALGNGKKYRFDRFSCLLATANVSGLTAYARITVQSASINSGAETQVVVFTSTTRLDSYATRVYNSEILSGTNETVTVRVYMKTSSSAGRAYMDNFSFVYTEIIPTTTSSAISIYNAADVLTVLDCCNELRPGCKMAINADDTGDFQYSENFADQTYEYTVTDSAGITYIDDEKTLMMSAAGYLQFRFDTKYQIAGVPFIVLNVVSGAPQIYISADSGGNPVSWKAIDGNDSTVLENAQAYRLLDSDGNLALNNLTKFHLKIASDGTNPLSINSIFMYADIVTIDAERPKVFKGMVNTFGAVVDSTASAIVSLKYNDADLMV